MLGINDKAEVIIKDKGKSKKNKSVKFKDENDINNNQSSPSSNSSISISDEKEHENENNNDNINEKIEENNKKDINYLYKSAKISSGLDNDFLSKIRKFSSKKGDFSEFINTKNPLDNKNIKEEKKLKEEKKVKIIVNLI